MEFVLVLIIVGVVVGIYFARDKAKDRREGVPSVAEKQDQREGVPSVAEKQDPAKIARKLPDGITIILLSIVTLGLYPMFYLGNRVREHFETMQLLHEDMQELRAAILHQDDDQEAE